jgi:hypothetical protein
MSTMSPEQILRLRILAAAAALGAGSTTESVDPIAVAEFIDPANPMSRRDISDHVALLERSGWVKAVDSLAGLTGIFLTPGGKDAATQFERAQKDPVARIRQLQDDYLRWVYVETEIEDRHPTPSQFHALAPSHLGLAYTEREIEKAGARLKGAGYIVGPEVDQYDAPIYPELTQKGRWVVENGKSVHDPTPTVAGTTHNYTTNVAGPANVANGSTNVTQTMHAESGWTNEATKILDIIAQAITALPAAIQAEVATEVRVARDAVNANEPSRAKQALSAIGGFLGDAGSGALGGLLAGQLLPVIALLS